MAQPAFTTGWTPSQNTVQPSALKKALGWIVNEKPAGSYFNWLFQTIELWLVWMQGLYGYNTTWTGAQIFTGSIQLTVVQVFHAGNPNQLGNTPGPVIYSSSSSADVVTLPVAPAVGLTLWFAYQGAGSLQILPYTGGTLNGFNASTGVTLTGGGTLQCIHLGAGVWIGI